MKKLFSKKSGFTLVEIIVAFAVFAIMAAMILQVIHLTINRQKSNREYEQNLAEQEEKLITNGKNTDYDASTKTGTLKMDFDATSSPMNVDYTIKDVEGNVNEKGGINYIVGDVNYEAAGGTLPGDPDTSSPTPADDGEVYGQKNRFDTRIMGTKGINSIKVTVASAGSTGEYNITLNIDSSGVDSDYKRNTECSLYFGDPTVYGSRVEVEDITYTSSTYRVQRTPDKCGVNLHGETDTGLSGTVSFKVKLASVIPGFSKDSFGSNSSSGTYRPFEYTKDGKTAKYVNIFGAFTKPEESTPTT